MNVFISWSKPRSEALGTFMRQWLGDLDPFARSLDIDG